MNGSGGSLLNILIQTVKARLTPLVTKFRLWTSWTYIRSNLIVRIRNFFYRLLGIRPRDKDDYFTIGRWMISRRLLYAAVIIIGVLSFWYITTETKLFSRFDENGVRTYRYNSVRLRMVKGQVRILGRSGYLAYDGMVSDGYAGGEGTLYNPEGTVIYSGTFEKSKYEGQGTLNYESGSLEYRGSFHENLFDGEGSYYREDGTRIYEGAFLRGVFNGAGTLYDSGENQVYQGTFSSGDVVYSELLGKTAAQTQDFYKGARALYYTEDESVVTMSGIGALCHLAGDPDALDDEESVDGVYVLSDFIRFGGEELNTIAGLRDAMGEPAYEGYSGISLPEAVSTNILSEQKNVLSGPVEMDLDRSYTDAAEVEGFDDSYVVYIYTFRRGDLLYSFVCGGESDQFAFYYITSDGEASV